MDLIRLGDKKFENPHIGILSAHYNLVNLILYICCVYFVCCAVYVFVAVVTIREQETRHSEHRSYGDDGDK